MLEIGTGNGLNFRHYPATVDEVFAVEPERHLRELAVRAAADAPVPVQIVDALAEELPAADVPPDGEPRFFEHVASRRGAARALQRTADATVWPRLAGGCHLARDTDRLIEAAGFEIVRCERFAFRIPPLDPPKTHIIGVARRADSAPRAPARA